MPGRRTPPTPERSRTWWRRALTSVPRGRPAPGMDDEAGRLVERPADARLRRRRRAGCPPAPASAATGGGTWTAIDWPAPKPCGGPCGLSLEEHLAVVDQRLDARAGQLGEARGEPGVEARLGGARVGPQDEFSLHGRSGRLWIAAGRRRPAPSGRGGGGTLFPAEPWPEDGRTQDQDDGDDLGGARARRRRTMPRRDRRGRTPGRSGSPSRAIDVGRAPPGRGSACGRRARAGRRRCRKARSDS